MNIYINAIPSNDNDNNKNEVTKDISVTTFMNNNLKSDIYNK